MAGFELVKRVRPFANFRDALVPATLAGSLFSVAWGLAHSTILNATGWASVMMWQVGLIALAAGCVTGVAVFCQHFCHIRMELVLAFVLFVTLIIAFGLGAVIVVALFIVSSTIIGTAVSAQLRIGSELPLIFCTAVGGAVYSSVLALLGPIPVNTVAIHALLLAAPFAILATPSFRTECAVRLNQMWQQIRSAEPQSPETICGLATLLFLILLQGLIASLPERYFDAMVMHLYIPSYVSANRAWSYDPTLYAFAFMPAAVDFLYTHLFLLQGEMAAKLYNLSAFILTCAVLYTVILRIASPAIAIWVVALLASMPIAFLESATLFIDNTLTLWLMSAIGIIAFCGLRPTLGHAVIGMILLVAACMSKMTGALAAVIIGLLILGLFMWYRRSTRETLYLLLATAVCAIVACFPYLFAWLKTGNPVFPLYNNVFLSPFFATSPFVDSRWIGHFTWQLLYETTFLSNRFLEAYPGALGLTALLLIPLAIAAMLVRPNKGGAVCLIVALAFMLPIASQVQYLRYLYPAFPIIFVPAACGLELLCQQFSKRAIFALLFAVATFNIYKMPSAGWLLGNLDLSSSFEPAKRRALVLATVPERLANVEINRLAGPSSRVLYTGNPFGALLNGKALYTDWYNTTLYADVAKLTNAEQARALLANWNVSHVVYSPDSTKPGEATLGAFLEQNYRPVAQFGRLKLYDLRPSHTRS